MRQRRGIVPGRPKCLAQFSLEYMATRLSGYVKRARGYPLLAQSRHTLVQSTCPVWVMFLRQRALPRKLNSAACVYYFFPVVVVIRYETTAIARWALPFIV